MKFVVRRTSDWTADNKPCENSYPGTYTNIDYRTVDDPKKIKSECRKTWYLKGTNHRLINGKIARDMWQKKCWYIDIDSLEQLIQLNNEHGELILSSAYDNHDIREIEIYDYYRE